MMAKTKFICSAFFYETIDKVSVIEKDSLKRV